ERTKREELARAEANATIMKARAQAMQISLVANATRAAIEMLIKTAGANATEATRLIEAYLYLSVLREVAQFGNVQLIKVESDGTITLPVIQIKTR
ncbi:MAG: prohibitin family protein, partial [Pyrobaculum sp.]